MNILSVGVGVATEIGLEHVSLVEADISTKRDWMARYIPRNDVTVSLLRGMFLIVKTIFYSKLLIEWFILASRKEIESETKGTSRRPGLSIRVLSSVKYLYIKKCLK